ncbi:MAG: uracil-DNA glycosylase [Dongiaceae bacterium]
MKAQAALPAPSCNLCPRLVEFRCQNQKKFPTFFNGAVPGFGGLEASFLIVGLAPGLKGANQTGRPFTGDYAGVLLYESLIESGFAKGAYGAANDDGLILQNCRITNAVRCVPPENKPTPEETHTCGNFLKSEIAAMPNLRAILSLGGVSHQAVLRAFDKKLSANRFAHGAVHPLTEKITLFDSYHCSRYNTQTKRLTAEMFKDVIKRIKAFLP